MSRLTVAFCRLRSRGNVKFVAFLCVASCLILMLIISFLFVIGNSLQKNFVKGGHNATHKFLSFDLKFEKMKFLQFAKKAEFFKSKWSS